MRWRRLLLIVVYLLPLCPYGLDYSFCRELCVPVLCVAAVVSNLLLKHLLLLLSLRVACGRSAPSPLWCECELAGPRARPNTL